MKNEIKRNDLTCHHASFTPNLNAFHRHIHNGYELLFFVRGDAEYIIEGSVYSLRENDLLLIRPRVFHCLKPKSQAIYERYVIHFPSELIPPHLLDFISSANNIYNIPKDSPIYRLYQNWNVADDLFSDEEMLDLAQTYVLQILTFLKNMPNKKDIKPIKENSTLQKILRYIDEHPTDDIDAEQLSAMFFMSKSWIIHSFRRDLGINLMQYITKKKIMYAEELIKHGKSPTDAAKICKYDSYVTFYRQYRKVLGHAPKDDLPPNHKKCNNCNVVCNY